MNLKRRPPENRYREYTISFPSNVADRVKRAAHADKITEQEFIKRVVVQALFETPADKMVEAVEATPTAA